jgi:hypothetical protein
MLQKLRPMLCHRATAAALQSVTRIPCGSGIADGLVAAPTILNGRSPPTGLAYPAAAQFRAALPGHFPSNQHRGIS